MDNEIPGTCIKQSQCFDKAKYYKLYKFNQIGIHQITMVSEIYSKILLTLEPTNDSLGLIRENNKGSLEH